MGYKQWVIMGYSSNGSLTLTHCLLWYEEHIKSEFSRLVDMII